MGTGKTRIVLANIVGTAKTLTRWNRRLEKTVILAPNTLVEKAWLRELLLLAEKKRPEGMRRLSETTIRAQTSNSKLKRLMDKAGIAIPVFMTFQIAVSNKKPKNLPADYLIIDEWHRLSNKVHGWCRAHVREGKKTKWFIGGENVRKKVFFVSATPVNPVLEQEQSIQEPYGDEIVEKKVNEAKTKALDIIQAIVGNRRVKNRDDNFIAALDSLNVAKMKYRNRKLKWVMPKEAKIKKKAVYKEKSLRSIELPEIANFMGAALAPSTNDQLKRMEYAFSVGLVRTQKTDGAHYVCYSKKGRTKRCFGKPYNLLYCPNNAKDSPARASTWLCENHSRLKRLINLLNDQGVIKLKKNGRIVLTGKKALIFCTHMGVALGLTESMTSLLRGKSAHDKSHKKPIVTNVDKSNSIRNEILGAFIKARKEPYMLIATDVLSESVDLHNNCKLIIHYELPWSPLRLFQRIGRLTRLKPWGKDRVIFNKDIRVAHVIIPGSAEEERVNRLMRRIKFLSRESLWPEGYKDERIASGLIGSGPSLHYNEVNGRN